MMLTEFPDQIIVADHHLGDSWSIPWTNSRDGYYGVTGTPTVWFDGWQSVVGAGSCSGAASSYRTKINTRLANTGGVSPVGIEGLMNSDATTLSLTATFEKLDPVTLSNLKAYLIVTENHLFYGGNEYNHVTRAVHEQNVTLTNVGDQVVVSHDFVIGAWNMDNVECSAWLQNNSTREIYQSARLPRPQDFRVEFDSRVGSAPDGNGTVEFHGLVTNISTVNDQLTFSLNNTWGWTAQFKMEGEANFHSTPVTLPVAPGQDLEVWVRVTTDASVRVGAGSFNTHSSVTDRTQPFQLRVFNGSPAIMVVDTDGSRTDETIILTALSAAGYLYDHWDAYNDHADAAPAAEDAAGYDILLFHQGWENAGLTTEAQQTIGSFMDAGHAVILSGQDYLVGLTAGTFTSNYLGVASWASNQDADQGIGIAGDPITDGMDFLLTYPQWNLDRADNLTASATGTVIMNSEEADRIAVRNDNGTARSVFFAFALNAMPAGANPNNVRTLLDRSIAWVMESGGGASVDDGALVGLPAMFGAVTPNPFTPGADGTGAAIIRLRVPSGAANQPARLDVVDLNGRLVRNLVNGPLGSGLQSRIWDGRDAAGQPVGAGVYYVRFTNPTGSESARLVLMR
jgi:hypothetical protein